VDLASKGKREEEALIKSGQVDDKMAEKLAKAYTAMPSGASSSSGLPSPNAIVLESWKADALALEKKVTQWTLKCSRIIQTAVSATLKLGKLAQAGNSLAAAQKDNLLNRKVVLETALEDFQLKCSEVDSKTSQSAAKQKAVLEPELAILQAHVQSFDKILKMATSYINMTS
jgi:hypothetical protein